jgi:hypothetical protein
MVESRWAGCKEPAVLFMSIGGLLAEAYSTNAFGPQVDTGQVGSGIAEGPADEHVSTHNKDQAETMVTMLDAGWTLAAIAAHFDQWSPAGQS